MGRKFQKKPVWVDAYQTEKEVTVETLEGTLKANVGDWIVTGVNGEKYPVKPDIFRKTYTESVIMDAETYIKDRLDDQINWLDKKSMDNQAKYKKYKVTEIILSGLIPFIAGFSLYASRWDVALKLVLGSLGFLVAMISSLLLLYKYKESWIEYRATCELLKSEKYLFLTNSPPYSGTDSFILLVKNVENILRQQNDIWQKYIQENKEENILPNKK